MNHAMSARVTAGGRLATAAALLVLLPGLVAPAAAAGFRVERGQVRITVPLRPGGAFEARTSALSGTVRVGSGRPLPLGGELSLDLASIDTGIALRNQHLREKYLEVAKGAGFDRAVLSDIRLPEASGETFEGRTPFSGTLLLHGVSRPVSGTSEIRREGQGVRVEARFPLELTEFGIVPPEYLGVGVASRLLVAVELVATPASGGGR